jgi:hypothetical protein
MRRWLSDVRRTFHALSQSRRQHLQEYGESFAVSSLFHRLWWKHLFWLYTLVRIEIRSWPRRMAGCCYLWYCRAADRMLGGDRCARYAAACHSKAEECEAKARRLQTSLQRNAEDRFIDRLADELLLNPNFVPPKKRIGAIEADQTIWASWSA